MKSFAVGDRVKIVDPEFLQRNSFDGPVEGVVEALNQHGSFYKPGHGTIALQDGTKRRFVADPSQCESVAEAHPEVSRKEAFMKVGDVVFTGKNAFRIVGVYLGGVGSQNLVGLECLTKEPGYAHGASVKEMFVPEDLVLTAGVYRRID